MINYESCIKSDKIECFVQRGSIWSHLTNRSRLNLVTSNTLNVFLYHHFEKKGYLRYIGHKQRTKSVDTHARLQKSLCATQFGHIFQNLSTMVTFKLDFSGFQIL